MRFRTFIIAGLVVSNMALAVDRRPAVEDFVGIEVDQPEATPQGTDSLVNLERDIQTIHAEAYTVKSTPKKPVLISATETTNWDLTNTMAAVLVVGLPLFSWLFIMNRLRKRAGVESASNVEVLERYRREREQARKKEEEIRKVS